MTQKKFNTGLPHLPAGTTVIDSHCHLDMIGVAAEMTNIVKRATAAGISAIVTVGVDLESSRKAVQLAEQFDSVYATVGTHPHNTGKVNEKTYAELEKLCRAPKVVAYGEVGLDYVKMYATKAQQLHHYDRQLDLACRTRLPVVIHDREAHGDILAGLTAYAPFPAGGVMHCFSGDWELARKVLDLDFFISIPGIITFNRAHTLQTVARKIPLDRLILETDAPFLTPVPLRGKKNFPEYVLYTARYLADLRGITLEKLADITTQNCLKLFNIQVQ